VSDQDRPDGPPPRRSVPQWTWDMIMLLVASLIATVVGLIVGGLVYGQTDQAVPAIIAAGVAFGGVLDRVLRIIRTFDRPPGN